MKYLYLIVMLCIIASCETRNPPYYFSQAYKADTSGNLNQAIYLYKKVISIDSTYALAYINIAVDYAILDKLDSAIYTYEQLLKQDPYNTLAWHNMGSCYKRKLDNTTAINCYKEALLTKGGGRITMDYVHNDNFYNSLADFDVPAAEICYERGLAYYDLDSLNLAFSDLSFSLKQGYRIPDCHFIIAFCFLKADKKEKACEHFNQAGIYGDKEAIKMFYQYCR